MFRLRRHRLADRAPRSQLIRTVGEIGGAQAQLYSAAQLSLWARVADLTPEDVDAAVGRRRTLSTAWCMRRTLHLVPSSELAVFVRGTSRRAEKEVRWMRGKGVSAPTLETALAAVISALDEPSTREELAQRLSATLGVSVRRRRGGGWGGDRDIPCLRIGPVTCPVDYLLHLVGARGVLCSGPKTGTESTIVRADAWVPRWHDLPTDRAEAALLRKYLRAYGPATPEDFMAWTRVRLSDAREIWSRIESELGPVDLDGKTAWLLRSDVNRVLEPVDGRTSVRLLPYFDSFVLGHLDRSHLVDAGNARRVYRSQGWVAPVVLVDGAVWGSWGHERKGDRLFVQVEPFGPRRPAVTAAIREEGRALARFLGCTEVEFRFDPATGDLGVASSGGARPPPGSTAG